MEAYGQLTQLLVGVFKQWEAMRVVFRAIWLLLDVCLALASNTKTSHLFGTVPEEQCMNFGCRSVKSVNYHTSCGQSVMCNMCQLSAFKPASSICSDWKLGGIERILLEGGSIYSTSKVGGQTFENLRAEWDGNEPIDINKCRLENFNYNTAYSAFSNGMYTSLYSTVTFSVVVLVNKPGGKKIPPLEFQIDLDETLEEINAREMGIRRKRDKSLCPISHISNSFMISERKTRERVIIISKSFSIPLDRSGVYRPFEFKLKVKCKKGKTCDLKYYKFCLRLSCSRMPESQLAQYKMVQELLKKPPEAIMQQDDEEQEGSEASERSESDNGWNEDEERPDWTADKRTHASRQVSRKVNRELQLEKQIVFNRGVGSASRSSSILSNNVLYCIVSGLVVLLVLSLFFIFLLRRRVSGS